MCSVRNVLILCKRELPLEVHLRGFVVPLVRLELLDEDTVKRDYVVVV
jgi:hypothetical protein